MPIISIYNNKGGEGKSTVTVGLAEFLAAHQKQRVLVIDLDAQSSSACALLGRSRLNTAVKQGRTSVSLLSEILEKQKPVRSLDGYFCRRLSADAKRSARKNLLAELAVVPPDPHGMFNLEQQLSYHPNLRLMRDFLRPALKEFDFVLIDHPANLNHGSVISLNGLAMSDYVVIPLRSSRISVNGLPRTFEMLEHVRKASGSGSPEILGLLLNATQLKHEQYTKHVKPIVEASGKGRFPAFFDQHMTDMTHFQKATDDCYEARTLKERFTSQRAYDRVRLVTKELVDRCANHKVGKRVAMLTADDWRKYGLA